MGSRKEKTDALFEGKLKSLEEETPFDAWPDIRHALEKKARKKRILFWRYSSIAAALLLAFFTGYYFDNYKIPPDGKTGSPDSVETSPLKQEKNISIQENQPYTVSPEVSTETEKTVKGEGEGDEYRSPSSQRGTPAQRRTVKKSTEATIQEAVHIDKLAIHDLPERNEPDIKTFGVSSPENSIPPVEEVPEEKSILNPKPGEVDEITSVSDTEPQWAYEPLKDNRKKKDTKSGVELSLTGGPSLPFRDVVYTDDNMMTRNNIDNEDLNNSYAGGIKFAFKTSSRWEIQAGLMVNNWSQSSNNIMLEQSSPSPSLPNNATPTDVNGGTSSGFLNFENTSSKEVALNQESNQYYLIPNISQEYQFVDIPLGAGYYFINKRFQLKAQAGLNTRILSASNVRLKYPDGSSEDYEGLELNDLSLQLSVGPGFAYRLNKRFKIQVDPLLYYGFTPVHTSKEINTYYHQFLIFSGFSYQF